MNATLLRSSMFGATSRCSFAGRTPGIIPEPVVAEPVVVVVVVVVVVGLVEGRKGKGPSRGSQSSSSASSTCVAGSVSMGAPLGRRVCRQKERRGLGPWDPGGRAKDWLVPVYMKADYFNRGATEPMARMPRGLRMIRGDPFRTTPLVCVARWRARCNASAILLRCPRG